MYEVYEVRIGRSGLEQRDGEAQTHRHCNDLKIWTTFFMSLQKLTEKLLLFLRQELNPFFPIRLRGRRKEMK